MFTRLTSLGPFYPPWVELIVNTVRYVPQLTDDQHHIVWNLLTEFADVFALSTREVKQVDFVKFRLSIPPDAGFSKKVHQCLLTQPQ
ncbi:uncharacterized protein F5147DRAFT_562521 [Suillus discolor]|uniref:Uncharacterized protein n=1 Tax=Suillus discolor TaxID=1912936 RepID=A0A9P7FKX1_9AGAM|nr:uncharacterized protein F5147DRAFT_562521 [Suillus discolor]KAG2120447.1 hypothetical protein F5147DRAFT_562521 [Suillus discolor]